MNGWAGHFSSYHISLPPHQVKPRSQVTEQPRLPRRLERSCMNLSNASDVGGYLHANPFGQLLVYAGLFLKWGQPRSLQTRLGDRDSRVYVVQL